MMIGSCLSTQRVAQIGFSFCRKEAEPEASLSTLSWNIDTRCAERDRKTHMSDIVAIAFLITGNGNEVLMTKLRTWLCAWPKGTISGASRGAAGPGRHFMVLQTSLPEHEFLYIKAVLRKNQQRGQDDCSNDKRQPMRISVNSLPGQQRLTDCYSRTITPSHPSKICGEISTKVTWILING